MNKCLLKDLVYGAPALRKMSRTKFKARIAYSISNSLREIQALLDNYSFTVKDLEKSDLTDEEKQQELQELLMTEINLVSEPISIEWLEDKDFTPEELTQLLPFIKE